LTTPAGEAVAPRPAAVRLVEPTRVADPYREMDLLRLSTAGSVDDGKSTLIGRLLYDTKSIFEDQLEAIVQAGKRRGEEHVNLALLTDGLRAEREQNITIDVAYRFFATPRRKFIIADTPGHLHYTRNMVTGASTADLAIVLIDARKGLLTQSRRHAFISSLLGIPHMVVAINKMDLVAYGEDTFQRIVAEFTEFASKLDIKDVVCIPVSALHGDNVVERSTNMPWYQGTTLLHQLESVNVAVDRNLLDFRFPVQYVIRPHQDYRGFAGQIASGTIRPGEEVLILPAGRRAHVKGVDAGDRTLDEGIAGDSVVLTLDDEIDVSRGDMIVRCHNLPVTSSRLDALVCWMSETPPDANVAYVLMHTTRSVRAFIRTTAYRIDVDTLHRETGVALALNDIGRVEVATAHPIFFDPYSRNQATGSFILVDPYTNVTVAAGMIRGEVREISAPAEEPPPVGRGAVWEPWNIPREAREARHAHKAAVVWLTGLSGSGKTTLARALEQRLFSRGAQTFILDGDQLRHGLNSDLGFSALDRHENVRRAGEVARLFFETGALVICSFVSPFAADRATVRALLPEGSFFEVYVDCAVEECVRRDPKGLYAKAARGDGPGMTGVTAPYEPPTAPELHLRSDHSAPEALVTSVLDALARSGAVPPDWTG
jgi:bifunctional enzyme CysN/CysC